MNLFAGWPEAVFIQLRLCDFGKVARRSSHPGGWPGGRVPPRTDQEVAQVRIRAEVAGATGLEPATSGVTGRVRHKAARRQTPLNGLICRHFSLRHRLRSACLSQSSLDVWTMSGPRNLGCIDNAAHDCEATRRRVPRLIVASVNGRDSEASVDQDAEERSAACMISAAIKRRRANSRTRARRRRDSRAPQYEETRPQTTR